MPLISKQQAVKLVGEDEVERIVKDNDTSLLTPSGCKLFTCKVGCVRRFDIYGYSHDGSDVAHVMVMI